MWGHLTRADDGNFQQQHGGSRHRDCLITAPTPRRARPKAQLIRRSHRITRKPLQRARAEKVQKALLVTRARTRRARGWNKRVQHRKMTPSEGKQNVRTRQRPTKVALATIVSCDVCDLSFREQCFRQRRRRVTRRDTPPLRCAQLAVVLFCTGLDERALTLSTTEHRPTQICRVSRRLYADRRPRRVTTDCGRPRRLNPRTGYQRRSTVRPQICTHD